METKECKSAYQHVCELLGSSSRLLANISKNRNFSNRYSVVHNFEEIPEIPGLSKGRNEAALGLSGHW